MPGVDPSIEGGRPVKVGLLITSLDIRASAAILLAMHYSERQRIVLLSLSLSLFVTAGILGVAFGMSLAANQNIRNMDELNASRPSLPSRVLDINGELITEFFAEEKREIIPITSLPKIQIYALTTREDALFYKHTGVALSGFIRALFNNVLHAITNKGYFSGFSTLTMQVAGARHADRSDISVSRKLKEIWWTYQLERRFTKQEILEQYLNSVYFGHNTYGVEAASQFFFGHSAIENSPAEAVMLVIQLAGSGLYSPITQPDAARVRQLEILNQMVETGYLNRELADQSFESYWTNYDWSRSPTDSPYFDRLANDQAPYFSEFIRNEVEKYLFGQQDIYRDGYTIHTTLNLEYQREAENQIRDGLKHWNRSYQHDRELKTGYASSQLVHTIDLLSLIFDLPEIHVVGAQKRREALEYLVNEMTPIMDIMSMSFDLHDLKTITNLSYDVANTHARMNNVETALITLDNTTGYILAMVGGSEFNRNNQFNRAVDASVMPGSAFKPLYYSAGINSGLLTAATRLYDGPRTFTSPDGTLYTPDNYDGRWSGYVLLREALARSLNIPALTVLETIGFDAAISRAADLMGMTDPQEIGKTFDRVYPLGLGTLSLSPIQLARAYATIGNRGKAVEPIAIRFIEDRDGNVIVNPERDLRESQERKNQQMISQQTAYIMANMLQSAVSSGTLASARKSVDGFDNMPIAGKTGTTQNWSDAWAVGFTPYYTTALWIGFDKRGNSLGPNLTGASAAGPVWARYMKSIHAELPRINFPRPETGIIEIEIDRRTGMLPGADSTAEDRKMELFIAGTQPKTQSNLTSFELERDAEQVLKISVDSSLTNLLDEGAGQAASSRNLLAELGLDDIYLENSRDPIAAAGDSDDGFNIEDILD